MNIISVLEQEQLRSDIPAFRPGDTVKVHVKVVEGNRERIQVFEGVVIGRRSPRYRSPCKTELPPRSDRQSCPYSRTSVIPKQEHIKQGLDIFQSLFFLLATTSGI